MITIPMTISKKGGAGSGNWGHVGRPGLVGGSGGGGGVGGRVLVGTHLDTEVREVSLDEITPDKIDDWFALEGNEKCGLLFEGTLTSAEEYYVFMGRDMKGNKFRWTLLSEHGEPGYHKSFSSAKDTVESVWLSHYPPPKLVGGVWLQETKAYDMESILLHILAGEGSDEKNGVIIPIEVKGGAGSGNWGHVGRPGLVGGSGGRTAFAPGEPGTWGEGRGAAFLNRPPEGGVYDEETWSAWEDASDIQRAYLKTRVVAELAEQAGLTDEQVNNAIAQWSFTSNNTTMAALSMQEAVAEEFGFELSPWQQGKLDVLRDEHKAWMTTGRLPRAIHKYQVPLNREQERTLVRAMYDNTQAQMAKAGIAPGDMMTLYRGIEFDSANVMPRAGQTVPYNGNTMESWSADVGVANSFAGWGGEDVGEPPNQDGMVISMNVPVRNILATPHSGFGCFTEAEYVLFGNIPDQKAYVDEVNVAG